MAKLLGLRLENVHSDGGYEQLYMLWVCTMRTTVTLLVICVTIYCGC